MTNAQALAAYSVALKNCEASNNAEWAARWKDKIGAIMRAAPSGGGFDSGTELIEADDIRIKLSTSFHHMNDGGYYDGWTEHVVRVTTGFSGIKVSVSGSNRNYIKDYIAEVFHEWLEAVASDATVLHQARNVSGRADGVGPANPTESHNTVTGNR